MPKTDWYQIRFPITFSQNKKGGMDSVEFEKYVLRSIVPLYSHAQDKKGHWVKDNLGLVR